MLRRCLVLAVALSPAISAADSHYWLDRPDDPVALSGGAPDFAAIAKLARPSVVSILATGASAQATPDSDAPGARDFFDRYYGGADPPTHGMASGIIIRSDGYILTNEHVVEDAADLAVSLGGEDDSNYPATVVGRDDLTDLALLKIDAGRPLQALSLGNSDGLAVGDWVMAIGNPFGLASSACVGIVSFIGRRDINPGGRPGYYDFIQTDAAINPGNSGGPLVDNHGRVVGLNAAVNATGQGIGFAIPINMIKEVLPALFETGAISRSFLGVSIQDLSPELAESFGVKRGVVVTEVTPDGPAERAGLQVGDVVQSFDGERVDHAWRLRWLASSAGPGKHAKLAVLRKAAAQMLDVTLAPLPTNVPRFRRAAPKSVRSDLPLGFSVSGWIAVSTGRGLRVSLVDSSSRAYIAGLREGDVILGIGDKPVRSPKEVASLAARAHGSAVRLFIERGVRPMYVAFRRD